MEMRRTILAVVLSMAVLLIFQKYLAPPPPAPTPEAGSSSAVPVPGETAAPAAPAAGGPAPGEITNAGSSGAPALTVTRTRLRNDLLEVDLSSRGAAVVGASLVQYREGTAADAPAVRLLSAPSGLDLMGATRLQPSAPQWGRVYEVVEQSDTRVVYETTGDNGVKIRKIFTLEPGHYDVSLQVLVANGGGAALRERLGAVMVQDFSRREDKYTFAGPAYLESDQYEEVDVDDLEDESAQASGTIWWAAFLEKYFLAALVPEQAQGNELLVTTHLGTPNVAELALNGPAFDLAPGGQAVFNYRLYMGPKLGSVLAPLGSRLDQLIDYGFFNVIAQPLLWFLNWLYGFIGNYGIAIVILTTVIKLVFWPLSAKSYKSMQRMKELQPKIQRIKDRYGDDKERLNMEVMQLYKTHKVNPLGGCLPMLVQIPFFFALYRILLGSIELRHAPFMLWITDLSAKDPYYITPVLMGATMFLQQKMTPVSGGNETQMKMMMYGMPLIFTFMFMNFPSGLVVYWLVNNVLSVGQQGWQLRQAQSKPASA